jgi:hypothetical protein
MLEDAIAAVPPELIGTGFILEPEQVTARLREFGTRGCKCRARASFGLHHGAGLGPRRVGGPKGRSLSADGMVRARQTISSAVVKPLCPPACTTTGGSPVEVTTWKQLGE